MDRPDAGRELLGLFPAFEAAGGVQASGRLAWEGIADSPLWGSYFFCYGGKMADWRGQGVNGPPVSGLQSTAPEAVYAASKLSAIVTLLRKRWPVRLVLVWHLGLLKLLPFLRVSGAKVVLFLHGIEAWKPRVLLTHSLLRRVDLFLSNSDYTWQRFVQANPTYAHAPHQTVHLGIEDLVNGDIPAPGNPPAALMLSRLVRSEDYKGHREMINAWCLVLKHIPKAELWIAGDGDLRPILDALAKERGLGGKVRFWGWVSEEKKQELLSHCRCLALPSCGEGFGLVYLEALRAGRPCLVSTLDAGRGVVNPPEAGLAVNPDDFKEVAAALCRLLSDGPEWKAWSTQARQRYERYFTAKHFQERLISALFSSCEV
ncbi:MAG: glycosyltransferase family 4 protein [Dehalococcoidia bacterium]